MATTVYTPVLTWVAALLTGVANGPSGNVTLTLHVTGGWEIQIPIKVQFGSQVSNDPVVQFYASSDGGANYDSQPMAAFALANTASGYQQGSVRLPTGQYAIRVSTSGGNTVTVFALTAQLLTALIGV
jgi:hypothetical protein